MAKFYTLFSSSSGNAAYLGNEKAGILFDIGVSCRRLCQALQARDISPQAVQAICITHTHRDHIAGLRVFLKQYPIPLCGTMETLHELAEHLCIDVPLIPMEQTQIISDNWEITPFSTPHDAAGSCGYRVRTADDRTCAVCTDLGEVTQAVREGVQGCDLVLLESNYEESMLKNGSYPAFLKTRIQGKEGHLSNADSAAFARQLVETGTTRLILGHLSQHNNTPNCAEQAALSGLSGMQRNRDYLLQVAAPTGLEKAVIF
ncbi:MAG: MBL fold metallo-hydrolase [Oscillospiraceae bacterium]|nr:MBL fold metallo-hydrolase [Oscillospiraceae bacterium]